MPGYPEGFTQEDFEQLLSIVREVGKDGPFDANDLSAAYLQNATLTGPIELEEGVAFVPSTVSGGLVNVGSFITILTDMINLGYLTALGGNPPTWNLRAE